MTQLQTVGEYQEFAAFEKKAVEGILKRLSWPMLVVLKRHGDGPQPIIAGSSDRQTTLALQGRGLLIAGHHSQKTPRETIATTLGRKVIAALLAQEAELLSEVANA
jgi:hypothetical protein